MKSLSIINQIILLLLAMMASGFSQSTKQDTLQELMRKVDILTREIEKEKLGEVAARKYISKFGMGPAASQVYYRKDAGVSIAGYGELVYQNYTTERDNDAHSGAKDQIDYLRNILYVGYKFNERFLFNAEIEFEHALAGDGKPGEVAMEFGYIDAELTPEITVRTGMVLPPVGIINEFHEPSTFYGALRPETERHIIPTTWRTIGAGIVGATASGIGYRAYVTEGFNAAKFSASGIRGGRQKGAEALAEDFGFTGRVEYTGIPGLNIGVSGYTGGSGQGMLDTTGSEIGARTTIFSAHGIFTRSGLEVRGLYAMSTVDDVAELNSTLGLKGDESIGENQFGYYITVAYNVLQLADKNSEAGLLPFVQYEQLNTHNEVPAGFSVNPALERTNLTLGVMYKPIPNLGFKADFINRDNEAGTALDQFNLALSYLF